MNQGTTASDQIWNDTASAGKDRDWETIKPMVNRKEHNQMRSNLKLMS